MRTERLLLVVLFALVGLCAIALGIIAYLKADAIIAGGVFCLFGAILLRFCLLIKVSGG